MKKYAIIKRMELLNKYMLKAYTAIKISGECLISMLLILVVIVEAL